MHKFIQLLLNYFVQGTRGKKDVIENYMDDYVDFVDFDKRAPMGFQGMRGKRNTGQKLGVNNEAFETQLSHNYRGKQA